MKVRVLFFASCREKSGTNAIELELEDGATTTTLMTHLLARYPELAAGASELKLAINKKYITVATRLSDGDEIALLPPISGG
jgi:molybdopterin converting factor subunit 1